MPDAFHSTLIPKSFRLGGFKIDVQMEDSLAEEEGILGQSLYHSQQIRLDPCAAPRQFIEQVYITQLVDWIFHVMGERELRENKRVSLVFANFLYQALVTAEPQAGVGADADAAIPQEDWDCVPCRPWWEEPDHHEDHDWTYNVRVRWWGDSYSEDDFTEEDYDEIEPDDPPYAEDEYLADCDFGGYDGRHDFD